MARGGDVAPKISAQLLDRLMFDLVAGMETSAETVCVTGKTTSFRRKPEIIATEPSRVVRTTEMVGKRVLVHS